jgi:hypothetical protein
MTTRQAGGVALVLIVVAIFLAGIFRSVELVEEHHRLTALRDLQDKALGETAAVRRRFAALAAGIAGHAAAGDAGAQPIAEELRRQGAQPAAPH